MVSVGSQGADDYSPLLGCCRSVVSRAPLTTLVCFEAAEPRDDCSLQVWVLVVCVSQVDVHR